MQVSSIHIILPTLGLASLLAVAWASLTVLRLRSNSAERRLEREGALQFELAAHANANATARAHKVIASGSPSQSDVSAPWESTIPAAL